MDVRSRQSAVISRDIGRLGVFFQGGKLLDDLLVKNSGGGVVLVAGMLCMPSTIIAIDPSMPTLSTDIAITSSMSVMPA